MNKLLSILIAVLLSGACIGQEKTNQVDEQGRKQGKWQKFDVSGTKIYNGEFKDDYEIGDFIFYYPTGKPKAVLSYSDKGTIAKSKVFYEDGALLSEGAYKKKKKDGIWIYYTESGSRISQESYKEGVKDGEWIVFDNDIIVEKTIWKNDMREGVWHKKFEYGYLYGTYKNNLLSGIYEEFYHSKKMKVKGAYENGMKIGEWRFFDPEGRLIKTEKWKNDFLISSSILLNMPGEEYFQRVDSIAYFYLSSKNLVVVTLKGEKITCSNPIDNFVENVEISSFMVVNWEKKFYARYSCIKNVEKDPSGKKLTVTLEPKTDFILYADEEAAKGLKSYFFNDPEEESPRRR